VPPRVAAVSPSPSLRACVLILMCSTLTLDVAALRRTALHCACAAGVLSVVALLIDRKAELNVLTSGGNTPLHLAAVTGDAAVVGRLARAGAK
jgi:hypothetical protein